MNILEDFYSPDVLDPEYSYSASGIYHQIQPTYDLTVSTAWVLGAGCWVRGMALPSSSSFSLMNPSHKDSQHECPR